MSYLNRFIIEEDIQFECNGIMAFSEKIAFQRFYRKHLVQSKKTIVHLIIAADFGLQHEMTHDTLTKIFLQLPEDKEIIISRIGSQRLECIQKEQYQKFSKEDGQVKIDAPQWKTELYKSIGDDIEDFNNRIKMNEINLIVNQTYETINDCWKKMINSISLNSWNSSKLIVRSFHLSMLTDQEESEILSKEKTKNFGEHQNLAEFRNKTTISENEQNFALSLCSRKTYYIKYDNENVLLDIDELNPWQEMIMKNHLESKRAKEKSLEKSLSNYLYWVPESDSDLESE